jgi:hypothetical protein
MSVAVFVGGISGARESVWVAGMVPVGTARRMMVGRNKVRCWVGRWETIQRARRMRA